MKLFKVSQKENDDYDTYSDFICCAKDEDQARRMFPSDDWKTQRWSDQGVLEVKYRAEKEWEKEIYSSWAFNLSAVQVELIGTAKKGTKAGVILASFHAG